LKSTSFALAVRSLAIPFDRRLLLTSPVISAFFPPAGDHIFLKSVLFLTDFFRYFKRKTFKEENKKWTFAGVHAISTSLTWRV
jgi:hypothetical protein